MQTKEKKRPIVTGILIVVILWTFGYMIFADGDGPSQPKVSNIVYVGEVGTLNNNDAKTNCEGNTVVGTSKENYDELTQAIIADDRMGYLQMLGNSTIFAVANCTEVKKIGSGFAVSEVRIMEGQYTGVSGWVASEFIVK